MNITTKNTTVRHTAAMLIHGVVMGLVAGIVIVLVLCFAKALDPKPDLSQIAQSADYDAHGNIICSMCGAHVSEWWYISDANGELVPVCSICYQECRQ